MQFYEGCPEDSSVIAALNPGASARFYETEDGARTRILVTEDNQPVWPR